MPIIKYTLRVEGEEEAFSETDTFPAMPERDAETIVREVIVNPLNERRASLSEPLLRIDGLVTLNPFVHVHSWKDTRIDRFALKVHCVCERCGITGFKRFHLFNGAGH